jgi:hypothetical protein
MKKNIYKILWVLGMLSFSSLKSQSETVELQKNDHLTNSEINLHSGVPNINLPLTHISVAPDNINIGVALSYSTEGASTLKMISDVGKGWSLQYGGSVFRDNSMYDTDYQVDDIYPAEILSGIYYYNFLGKSGRFYISKDQNTGQLVAVQLEPSNNKIVLQKDNNNTGKIISFSIIDENGNTFLFDKINVDYMRFADIAHNTTREKIYNNTFLLTTITNNKNQQVATFEYETTTELISQIVGTAQQHKIKKINVNNYGSIIFTYQSNSQPYSLRNKGDRDWYHVDKLILKDKNNAIISQYTFSGNGDDFLRELTSLDKDNNVLQKYSFEYTPNNGSGIDAAGYVNGYTPCNLEGGVLMTPDITTPSTVASNSLKSITLPTGGRIEYEFESNSVAVEASPCTSGNCYNYYDLDKIYTWTFDSSQSASSEVFSFPSGYQGDVYVVPSISSYPPLHAPPPGVTYSLDIDLQRLDGGIIGYEPFVNTNNSFNCSSEIRIYKTPLEQIKTGIVRGNIQGYGKVDFYAVKQIRQHKNAFGAGLRIKSIKNYDAGSVAPAKWVQYEYNQFLDPLTSSGSAGYIENFGEISLFSGGNTQAIEYENVKVINMLENTSTKYIFYNATELSNMLQSLNSSDIDFGGFLGKEGLLKQKEVYNTNNNLLQKTNLTYILDAVLNNSIKYHENNISKIFIKKESTTVTDYIDGSSQALIASSENTYENQFNNLVYTKETLYDGSIVEKSIQYAKEKNIQKLLDANMVGIPVETEVKSDGKVISRAETKLDDSSTLYPTSALNYNIQNQNSSKKVFFNNYDNKGNLRELKSEKGIPTVTIWGYHQTQPIAKIMGASYTDIANLSTVTAAIAASDNDDNDSSNEPALMLALDNLRKDDALKNYQIETYTYDPFIGITSKTTSNGLKETYVYDSSHRMYKVLDKDGKVIKTYDYHYAPQLYANDALSGEYITNNCGAGYLPNMYMYTVPANKYFSYTSKNEANQQAMLDIETNGQNIANQIGGCRSVSCTISKGYDIAVLNSGSVTMPDASNFRLQMSFPYDSSISWLAEKSIGKLDENCINVTDGLIVRNLTAGEWKISIYPNGNIRARRPSTTSIPNGTIINIDVTTPVDYIPEL